MPLAAAVVGAAVIGGGAAIITGNKAAKTAKNAAASNNALQTKIYEDNKATLAPFVGQGGVATPVINNALGLSGGTAANDAFNLYKNSTGYDFRQAEGLKSVQAALGARGLLDSGAAGKSLMKYGQGLASSEFGNWLGALTGQQGVGLTAASAQAGVGQGYANASSANNNNAANASGQAALGTAGAINGVLNNGVSALGMSAGMKSSYGGGALTGATPPILPYDMTGF